MTITYTVEVKDNKDGTLTANVSKVEDTEFNNKYETVNVYVLKVWNDKDDQDGIQPEDIQVVLKADGKELETITLSEENEWTNTWTGLVKHSKGVDIDYTVEELVPDGYEANVETQIDESGNVKILISNVHEVETVSITTIKVWEDYDNYDGYRPEYVKVQLQADGEAVETVELNEENDWTYTWEGLDKNKAGEEIVYTVEEIEIPNMYTVEYSIDEDGTLVITNTQIPGEGGYEPEPEPEPEEIVVVDNPSTGMNILDSFNLYIALIVGTIFFVVIETKRLYK